MYGFHFDILRSLLSPLTGQSYGANIPAPLGSRCQVSAKSLGLVHGDGTGRDWLLTLMFVRFATTVAGAGSPVGMSEDATYKGGAVSKTYAAGFDYAPVGITCHAVAAAGDYGFIQVGGLSGWSITAAAAAVAPGNVMYWSATDTISVAATDANRLKRLGVAQITDADGGALAVGGVMLCPIGLGL